MFYFEHLGVAYAHPRQMLGNTYAFSVQFFLIILSFPFLNELQLEQFLRLFRTDLV